MGLELLFPLLVLYDHRNEKPESDCSNRQAYPKEDCMRLGPEIQIERLYLSIRIVQEEDNEKDEHHHCGLLVGRHSCKRWGGHEVHQGK